MDVKDLVEIAIAEPDDFLKIKETLTRIGIASKREKKLYQSCLILHKNKGQYYITHFKEMFALDGRENTMTENDIARRNTICNLLEEWGLLTILDKEQTAEPVVSISQIKIIKFSEKEDWELCPKYQIGVRH